MEYRISNKEYRISMSLENVRTCESEMPVLDFISTILYNNNFNGIQITMNKKYGFPMSGINPVNGVNKSLFNIFTNSKLSIPTIYTIKPNLSSIKIVNTFILAYKIDITVKL